MSARKRVAANTETQNEDGRLDHRYELWSDMTDEYRNAAARIVSFQTLAELVGVLPFAEWIDYVPDFQRRQMLIAKVQDEVGHGHVVARIAEDLGKPREQILQDYLDGKAKILNVFHYGFETWEEVGPAALLMNSAAIVQFQSLKHGTYAPYARALRKIEKEESFHYHHALDLTHEIMTNGVTRQRALAQEAFERWMPRLLAYFGPPDSDRVRENAAYQFGLKVDSNDVLRQRWLTKMIPVFEDLGIRVDHELVHFDEEQQEWQYTPPDWTEVKQLIVEGGPRAEDWRRKIATSLERNSVYRDAALRQTVAA